MAIPPSLTHIPLGSGFWGHVTPTHRLAEAATCQALLEVAGFTQVGVMSEQLGYYMETSKQRWADIEAGPEGASLRQLSKAQYDEVKATHLEELQALMTPQGLWADVSAHFVFGWAETARKA